MRCTDEGCTAQLSAFCLQRDRDVPLEHTRYQAADPGAFRLLAARADGSSVQMPVDERIRFTSAFGFASVRISVPAEAMKEWGAVALAVEVSPEAALVPSPHAADADPLSAEEIALATGPLRALAGRHFDAPSTHRDAAQLLEANRSLLAGQPAHVGAAYLVAVGLILCLSAWAVLSLRHAEAGG